MYLLYICRSPLWVFICMISDWYDIFGQGGGVGGKGVVLYSVINTERRRSFIHCICFFYVRNLPESLTFGCVNDNTDIYIKNKIFVLTKINVLFHKLFDYLIFIMVYLQLSSKICMLLYWLHITLPSILKFKENNSCKCTGNRSMCKSLFAGNIDYFFFFLVLIVQHYKNIMK